jgi:hypothetical protein
MAGEPIADPGYNPDLARLRDVLAGTNIDSVG